MKASGAATGSDTPVSPPSKGDNIMLIYAAVILAVLLVAAGCIYFIKRVRPYDSETLVLRGAVNSIIDGTAHPEMQRLLVPIPGLTMKEPVEIEHDSEDGTIPGQDAITRISAATPQMQAPTTASSMEGKADPRAISAAPVPQNIFREYDIRGLVDKELTPSLMSKIGLALGTMVVRQGRTQFVVGGDNRLSGEKLMKGLVKGLASSGMRVTNVGIVPTPVLYYSINKYSIPDGVMLTGSHNGYEYNGCKIVIGGTPLKSSELTELYNSIVAQDFVRARGSLTSMNPFSNYIEQLLEAFSDVKVQFHIAVDCAHGVTGAYIPFVLRKLGCKVTELACGLDQNQARHAPDPTVPEHLQELQKVIQESSGAIDFGLAYDGDGDRLIIVDGSGNIIWPDKLIMLFARNLLEKNPGGTIVYDVKCSSALKPWIEQHGGVPLMWKTGHSLIRNKMNEVDAVLAGELSGHIFWRDWYGFDDAIYSSCRLIRLLQESGKKLSDMLSELPGGQASPEYRIAMQNDGQAQTTMKQVRAICTNHSAKLVDIDGLRFEYPDRWGLIRPSNTSPVMVCRFEGDDSDKLAAIKKEIHDLLHQVDASLDIPF